MSIKNLKIRFNLDKENDRKAYEYLQGADHSYSKAVISAICEYLKLSERAATEDAFLERVIATIKEELTKANPLAAYYNLCRHRLHKFVPKRKTKPKRKKPLWILWTTFKVTKISAFDGTVMAFLKEIATTPYKGSTILGN